MGFEDFLHSQGPWDPPEINPPPEGFKSPDLLPVRMKNGDTYAPEKEVRRYVQLAREAEHISPVSEMHQIQETLNENDLRALAHKIYRDWLKTQNANERKGVLILYGLHATDEDVVDLWNQLEQWLKEEKAEEAADALLSLTLSRSEMAPMVVHHVGRNTDLEKVRLVSSTILEGLAVNLGIDLKELGDYLIPTLQFDFLGQRTLECSCQKYLLTLSPYLNLELEDANGVLIAVPPEPKQTEDTPGAVSEDNTYGLPIACDNQARNITVAMDSALRQFYSVRKTVAGVVHVQGHRLRLFMLGGHNWDKSAWDRLFRNNSILHIFACSLIWGIYDEQQLLDTFRCTPGGGFVNVHGDNFDFEAQDDNVRINPAHPLEMEETTVDAWRAQLESEGIEQPFQQMELPLNRTCMIESPIMGDPDAEEYDPYMLKGFDINDCSDANRYHLERLSRILGIEGKELFLDIFYNGHPCLKERVFYALTYEDGDAEMDAIVRKVIHNPENRFYPWLILALERNKNPYWLNKLSLTIHDQLKRRLPNAFGARGLIHSDLKKHYDMARDTFILYWEENLRTDMGIYAFEVDAEQAARDIVPYILQITPETRQRADMISLYSVVQGAYRNLTPNEFYNAFRPVFDNEGTRPEFVKAFLSRVKYDWNKRDITVEYSMDIPINQLLKFDSRWYKPFIEEGLTDLIIHSVTPDMPKEEIILIFTELIDRNFTTLEELGAFYKYTLGMLALGEKDFMTDMLKNVKALMSKLPYDLETFKRLAYHMERETNAFGDEFWLQQFILLDPTGFAGVFEKIREKASAAERDIVDRLLTAIYAVVYRR